MTNNSKYCYLPERDLPVISEADVIIAGATLGSISAALKAAGMGAKVFVIGYMPYMGEDICGTYKYLFEDQVGEHPLLEKLFPKGEEKTPFHVKKVLENALIDNNVDFLYSSYVTEVLFDDRSKPTGVIITNRSGQQIIRGKVIIDATQGAYAAKLAGACFRKENSGQPQQFQFITVGNTTDPIGNKRVLPVSPKHDEAAYPANEYTFHYQLENWSFSSLCNLEQEVRGRVWDPDQVDAADHLFYIPPFKIEGLQSYTDHMLKMDNLPVEVCMPSNLDRVYVLSSCADICRAAAQDLLKPENIVLLGEKIGTIAADSIRNMDLPSSAAIKKSEETNTVEGLLRIAPTPTRPAANKTIQIDGSFIPVIGEYDVVIMGGGTAGANAGISAARHGAKTLVLEYLHGLGGIQTMGRVCVYWDGYREGFTREVDKGVSEMAPADHPRQITMEGHSNNDWKMEWYRRQIRESGGDIWFGVLGGGALVDGDTVTGVLIATQEGMYVVQARIVIDSTGSADIAIAAGAGYEYSDRKDFAVQGAGLPHINLGDHNNNTDWTFIDDSDVFDVTRLYVSGKAKYDKAYDIGKLPQTRERRRIIGDHMISVLDVINHRRYSDTISYHKSSFDTHGYTIDPFFTILPPEKRHTIYDADVPLRSLLPRGLDNILVTGLGASAHRDAMPVIRMQPCLQNQGYSVGYLSALAVKENCSVRQIDIKKVQAHLVEKNILPERVLTDTDNMPFTDDRLKEAVLRLPQEFAGLEILLTNPQKAEEQLLEAFSQSSKDSEKVPYAQVLCMLGNGVGMQYIIDRVRAYSGWDEGWNYTGMGQFGPCMSKLDSLIIALGETREEKALPAILEKAKLLTPEHAFSHFRAVALACEAIGSPSAVQVLSELLDMEGVTGHHVTDLKHARDGAVPSTVDVSIRNKVLREIYIARALYRCGDDKQKGAQILKNYRNDLHGHYFRHASGILSNHDSKKQNK
jgi:flavin-dependent dehydrogenase